MRLREPAWPVSAWSAGRSITSSVAGAWGPSAVAGMMPATSSVTIFSLMTSVSGSPSSQWVTRRQRRADEDRARVPEDLPKLSPHCRPRPQRRWPARTTSGPDAPGREILHADQVHPEQLKSLARPDGFVRVGLRAGRGGFEDGDDADRLRVQAFPQFQQQGFRQQARRRLISQSLSCVIRSVKF